MRNSVGTNENLYKLAEWLEDKLFKVSSPVSGTIVRLFKAKWYRFPFVKRMERKGILRQLRKAETTPFYALAGLMIGLLVGTIAYLWVFGPIVSILLAIGTNIGLFGINRKYYTFGKPRSVWEDSYQIISGIMFGVHVGLVLQTLVSLGLLLHPGVSVVLVFGYLVVMPLLERMLKSYVINNMRPFNLDDLGLRDPKK